MPCVLIRYTDWDKEIGVGYESTLARNALALCKGLSCIPRAGAAGLLGAEMLGVFATSLLVSFVSYRRAENNLTIVLSFRSLFIDIVPVVTMTVEPQRVQEAPVPVAVSVNGGEEEGEKEESQNKTVIKGQKCKSGYGSEKKRDG